MTRLIWDSVGSRLFETGVDRGVLYLPDMDGIPWNGLTEVSDSPDGGEVTSYWLDGVKYLDVVASEDYKAEISAYTYPDEFELCQGVGQIEQGLFATAQPHSTFGLSYRTKIGNDIDGADFAYRVHIVYNATVAPLARDHKTLTGAVELDPFKWSLTATPVYVPGMKPTAHFIVDSRSTDPITMSSVEAILYGDDGIQPHIPTVENLINLIVQDGAIQIIDNGDGTWTALGPNEFITDIGNGQFQISEANVTVIDDNTYTIQDTVE